MVFVLLLLPACTQWQQVRPYTDFVKAEIKPGDKVRIETSGGTRSELQVAAVMDDRIIAENRTVLLRDIVQLEKQSKSPPANPCSPQIPLGCSVPDWAKLLHDSQPRFQDHFYPSCEQHDFCYRHGFATYGKSRDACDTEFLSDMQSQCQLDNIVEILLVRHHLECNAVALEFYTAVQKYGDTRFKFSNSTYCEYDGPP
jgi:hypothetical protein